MKIAIYILLIALSLLAPTNRLDVSKLQPVEAIAAYTEGSDIVLLTDTEDKGRGATIPQALANLKETTTGIIYLDTAEYLLVSEDAQAYIPALMEHLKPTVKVGQYSGGNVKEEAKYLDAHGRSGSPGNE